MHTSLLDAAYDAIEHGDCAHAVTLIEELEFRGGAPKELGDVWWRLARLFDERELPADLIEANLRAWIWDQQVERPEWALSLEECQVIVDDALARLPSRARDLLSRLPIILDAAPTREMVSQGVDPRLLGLFQGVPYPHKSVLDASPEAPDSIIIFLLNLENASETQGEFVHELKKTVWHETAHAFGLNEDEVYALGLG